MKLQTIIRYYKSIMKHEFNCEQYAQQCAEEVVQSIYEFAYLSHDDENQPDYLSRCYWNMPIEEANAWIKTAAENGIRNA